MFGIKFVILLLLFGILFVTYVMYIRKKYDTSKLKLWKLFLEFYIANFVFFISSLMIGLFGVKLMEGAWQIFAVLFLLIIPALYIIVTWWVVPAIMRAFQNNPIKKKYSFLLLHCLVFNRFYETLIIINILYWLKSKIF